VPNLGFGEILVIVLIALLVFGPKKLPEMGKTVGRSLREFRKAASDVRAELAMDKEPPTVPSPAVRKALEDRAEQVKASGAGEPEQAPPPTQPDPD
jgi:sec-independent protein translocase protein TatA